MIKHTRITRPHVRLEALVEHTDLTPVQVERLDIFITNSSSQLGLFESSANGSHGWLRGETRHGVDGNIYDVGSSCGSSEHGSSGDSSSVVRVDVDREVGIALTDGTDEPRRESAFVHTNLKKKVT